MYIGRKNELAFLESKYEEEKGQLIVLYGRRRVGKTETLREFCKNKEHVFYSCRECTDYQQLQAFSKKILQKDMPIARYVREFRDWEQALESILEFPGAGKKLLVIDEFPYMCRGNSSIPSILQNLWDEKLRDKNVMLILCGSAMSFIEKELLAEKNPLYGRATGIYKMEAMPFADAVRFFPDYSPEEQLTAYAILGGVPHYLTQFDRKLSLEENITKNILTKGCTLYSEIEFLLRQELRETAVYNTIIEAIALGNTGLNDIYNKTQIEKTKLSAYLRNLIDLEIVVREFSVSDTIKEHANSSRGLYKLADNFFRFWYSFVFPFFSELETGDAKGVCKYFVLPKLDKYVSVVFEEICREYIRFQNRNGQLPVHYAEIGRWWGKTQKTEKEQASGKEKKFTYETEIDVMAIDLSKKHVLLGECKYKRTAFSMTEYLLLKKKEVYRESATVRYYLFSRSGFEKDLLKLSEEGKLVCVTVEEMVQTLLTQ